ncbi:hypothetical protein [Paenibacillus sp. MABNR03]|uniref:hypothetical protein n=1 Tax=Paenibacillus sp. MABNR03 TaxID=3142626 RepID=UPI003D29E0C3
MRIAKRIGIMSSMGSMILWVILILFNPYTHERAENDVIISTLFSLFIPALV